MENKNREIEFKIEVKELFSRFKNHLDDNENRRIFFSGKFGIGKTYFLKEFFEEYKEEYEVFHLFPVNYQISSNEDIIDFLKYDVLVELLNKNNDAFQENDYSSLIDMQRLLFIWEKDNVREISKTGLSFIPKLGKPLKDVVGLMDNFYKFKQKMEFGEKGFIEDFFKKVKEKNISETDYLSELLKEKIKIQKKEKKSILVLDDLDRIDPEHIFRILNIMSFYFDLKQEESINKFDFDKIIIVADKSNLKSIFHHRYGLATDFMGYLDKFFSGEIYQFQNEEIIKKGLDEVLSNFKIDENKKEKLGGAWEGEGGYLRIMIRDILSKSLYLEGSEKLNMRQLFRGTRFEIPAFKNTKYDPGSPFSQHGMLEIIRVGIRSLISIFSGLDSDFINVLEKIKNNYSKEKSTRAYQTFAYHILYLIQEFKTDDDHVSWKQYYINLNHHDKTIGEVKFKDQIFDYNLYNLYFDLLIEYISHNLYEKEVNNF